MIPTPLETHNFMLPSPRMIPEGQVRQTRYEASGRFVHATIAYLENKHKGHCSAIHVYQNQLEDGVYTFLWNEYHEVRFRATQIPPGLKSKAGRAIELSRLNFLIDWLCDFLEKATKSRLIKQELRERTDQETMVSIFESVVEALIYRPINHSRFKLLGVASFMYWYGLTDFDEITRMAENKFEVSDLKSELDWFRQFMTAVPIKKFKSTDFEYSGLSKLTVDPTFRNDLLKCADSRFILMDLAIQHFMTSDSRTTTSHANMLLYDRTTNTVERFEPDLLHDLTRILQQRRMDRALAQYFNDNLDMKYVSPMDWCPVSIQGLQEREVKMGNVTGKTVDFCQAWSFWYADLRLSNPEISREQVIDYAVQELKTRPETLTEYIIAYTKKYEEFLQ